MSDRTEEIRDCYAGSEEVGRRTSQEEGYAEFDRMLERERAAAWEEGLDAGADRWMDSREFGDKPVNPYETEANR